jgi:hypothetical protein
VLARREQATDPLPTCAAREVRAALLEVAADKPPPRHAVIRGWPYLYDDPELQKAQQKERAISIASKAMLLRRM